MMTGAAFSAVRAHAAGRRLVSESAMNHSCECRPGNWPGPISLQVVPNERDLRQSGQRFPGDTFAPRLRTASPMGPTQCAEQHKSTTVLQSRCGRACPGKNLSTRPEPQVPHLPTGLAVGLGLESTLDRLRSCARKCQPISNPGPALWVPRFRTRGIWRSRTGYCSVPGTDRKDRAETIPAPAVRSVRPPPSGRQRASANSKGPPARLTACA